MANKKIALVTIAMSGALMTLPSHPVLAGDIAEVTEWYNTDQIMTIIPGADAGGSGTKGAQYKIGDANWQDYTGPIDITNNMIISMRTLDVAGNISDVRTVTVRIDKIQPTAANVAADVLMATDQIVISITPGTDTDAGVKQCDYQVQPFGVSAQDGDWLTYTAEKVITDEGKYTIYARTVDNAGNVSEITSLDITIDRTAPTEPSIVPDQFLSNDQIRYTITDGVDDGVGIEKTEYRVLDKVSGAVISDWMTYTTEQTITAEGVYTIEARTLDKLGNTSNVASVEFTIDKTPPAEIIVPDGNISPAGGQDQDQVEITVPDAADPADSVSYAVVVSGSGAPAADDTWLALVGDRKISVTEEGTWDIYIKVIDPAGNSMITGPITIMVDRTAPTEPIITPDQFLSNDQIRYTITDGIDDGVGIEKTEYRVLDKASGAVISDWMTYTTEQTITAEGVYTIEARTLDKLGNTSNVASVEFTIDKTPPAEIIVPDGNISPAGGQDQDQVEITVPDAADPADSVSYAVVVSGSGAPAADDTWLALAGDRKISVTEEGTWDIYIKVIDPAGNSMITGPITIMIDRTAPTEPTITPDQFLSNDQIRYTITDGIDDGVGIEKTEYRVLDKASGAVISDWMTYTTEQTITAEGVYTIEARTVDKLGNTSSVAEVEFSIDKTPPAEIIVPDGNISPAGGQDQDQVEVTVPDAADLADSVSYAVVTSGSGAPGSDAWRDLPSDKKITVTEEGTWDIYIKVIDSAGNSTITGPITIMIDRTAPTEPIITPDQLLSNDQIRYTITDGVDDRVGVDHTEFRVLDKASGAVISDWMTYTTEQTITAEGVYTIEARTLDKLGNVSNVAAVEFTIDKTPPAEIIVPDGNISPAGGQDQDKVEVTVPDAADPADSVSYAVVVFGSGAPAADDTWLALAGDRKISVTEEGTWDIYIKVIDPAGNSMITGPITIMIDRTAPTEPTIMPDQLLSNDQISYTITDGVDDRVGVDHTEFRVLDKASGSVLNDWSTYAAEQTITAEGVYSIEARTLDKLGNVSNVAAVEFTIDKTPPAEIVVPDGNISPAGGQDQDQVEVTVPDAADPADSVSYAVVVSGSGAPAADDTWLALAGDRKISVTEEGTWDIYIKVIDPAGNSTITGPITIMIDRTAPTEPTIMPDQLLSNDQISYTITDGVDDRVGVDHTEFRVLDKASGAVINDWMTYTTEQTITAEGVYTIEARTLDKLGNVSNVAAVEFTIDKTPPAEIIVPDGNISPAGGQDQDQVEVTVPDAADPADSVSYAVVTSGSGAPGSDAWRDLPSDKKITVTEEGTWDIYIKVIDPAGNSTITGPITIMIDRTAPTEPTIMPDQLLSNDQISYTITDGVDDRAGVDHTEFRVLDKASGAVISDWMTYTTEQTITAEGVYTIEARTLDKLGNVSNVAAVEFTIDKTPPAEIIVPDGNISPAGGQDQDKVEITVPDAADPADSVSYAVVTSGSGAPGSDAWRDLPSDKKITVTEEGTWDIYIKVIDPAGNSTITGPITIMVDRSGPEIIFNGLIPDEWQKGNRFTVSATDAISGPKQIAYWFSYDNTKQYIDVAAIHSEINGEGKVVHYTDNSVGIPDGEFDIFAQAADRMDNLGDVASIHVKIDTADPILQFAPDANEQNTAFAIELIASDKLSDNAVTDNASGVDRIVYSIRNNTAEIQEEYNEPIKIEAEGQYYLEATAIDHAGNQSVIEKKTYIMDTTSPVIVEVIVTRAKPAVVEIVAHDKTELEYSFDAGITWQKERMKNYMQNTILPAEAIQVRDAAGNITKWPQAVRVVLPSSGGGGGESIWPPEDNENEKQLAKEVERELAGGKDRDGQPLYLKTGLSADRGQLAKGYLAGYEDNTFRPERAITRGEAAALLGRVLDIEQNVSAPKTYLDIDDHWATADIALVQSRDLIPDQGEYFEPDRDITIGEMSRVLDNILDLEAYDSDSAKTSTGSIEVQATQRAYNAGLLPVKDEAVIDTRAKMSRVETVIVFNRVFGLNDQDIRRPAFKDITMQDWYYGDVGKATLKVCTKCEQAN